MNRTLDLVLLDFPSPCIVSRAVDILSTVDSLHPPLNISINFSCETRMPYNKQYFSYNFYKTDYQVINAHLSKINWFNMFGGESDVNKLVQIFYTVIREVIDKFVQFSRQNNKKVPILVLTSTN